tara:strand:- start:3708 stop:3839 length:132 start_codon:yes stop_codon:yes gene_type:complete
MISIVGLNSDNESNSGIPNSKSRLSPDLASNFIQEFGLFFDIC